MTEDELMQLIIKADPRPDVPKLYTISGVEYRHFERFAALVEAAITSPTEARDDRFVAYAITSQRPIPPEKAAKGLQAEIKRLRADAERYRFLTRDDVDFCREPLWHVVDWMRGFPSRTKAEVDEAIDAAIAEERKS